MTMVMIVMMMMATIKIHCITILIEKVNPLDGILICYVPIFEYVCLHRMVHVYGNLIYEKIEADDDNDGTRVTITTMCHLHQIKR